MSYVLVMGRDTRVVFSPKSVNILHTVPVDFRSNQLMIVPTEDIGNDN